MRNGLGVIEVTTFTHTLLALDAMDKAASVRVLQMELNDYYGVCVKVTGDIASLRAAMTAGKQVVANVEGQCVTTIIPAPASSAWAGIKSPAEFNPLLEANVVFFPNFEPVGHASTIKERPMSEEQTFAIGLIETQGFTAVIEAIDSACKAADVEVIGKEKLGGGYITVIVKGDVAAVKAAVESGKEKVEGLGNLIAAHIIARPSKSVLSLMPTTDG